MKKARCKINISTLLIILLVFISLIIFEIINKQKNMIDNDNYLKSIALLVNILFIICIYFIYKKKKNIFDFNIIFLAFLFLFCYGQVFLYSVGVTKENLYLFSMFNCSQIIEATIYFYFSLIFYILGMSLYLKKDKELSVEIDENLNKAIKKCAIILLLISIIPFFYLLIPTLYNSIVYGYMYNFDNAMEVSGITGYLSKFFIPSIFMLLYTLKKQKHKSNFLILFLMFIAFLFLLRGSKGSGITILIGVIVFYSTFIKKIKGINIIKIVPIIILITVIIPVISEFRGVKEKNITDLGKTFSQTVSNPSENFIVKTIEEMGGTMQAFILTKEVIPSQVNYKYGESYFASIMMLIPSPLLGGYSFAPKAALDTWLMKIHNMSYGPGYSLIAETYYNFGWHIGIIFTTILGIFFTKMFSISSEDKNKNELLRLLSFIFLYNSMIKARFPFHEIARNAFYMYFLVYIVVILIYNQLVKKSLK